ncbi:glycoside hydrolase family 2 TIM barrel-domain containing protein [uncultured Maribacter sp.]|uniref:glycoside hydrolase family 2 TIM barrel-domain containing protein n=1 Tax=uncultured Maribacter sp. TaxID=431308 RepID=UPI00262C06DC|nr:glycoside hydrolase family 2 TIM barrel-domain containing protein [uncultured Maribacter sp.]
MNNFKYILISVFYFTLLACNDGKSAYIEKQNFNKDWAFKILEDPNNDNYSIDSNNWEKVLLPHTPKIEPKIVNNQWQGICWYRKYFEIPDKMKDKKLFLKFEGAMNIAEVWVNDNKLIEHHGGYLPFVVDFSDVANFNKINTVAVRLNNNDNPITGPKPLNILDFNTYGGIHRNVWLISKNKLHITDPILTNKTASGGVFVTYPKVSQNHATIKIDTHVKNEYKEKSSFSIKNTLLSNGSELISEQSKIQDLEANKDKVISTIINVNEPKLWSPQTPNLYVLKTEIILDGKVIDQEIHKIGIKTMKFIEGNFYLNGIKTFLRGVNRHQEYPHVGYAISDNANYRDAKKIKDAGFDYVRLSHYPHAPSFMDACDELGIITIDAILGWQYFTEDKKFKKHIFQTARDLIRRDRNHASVMAWEVSLNESAMPKSFIDSLTSIAHQEYPGDQCFSAGWQSYGYDIYLQARQHRLEHFDKKLKKPYNVSEYGDWEYYAMNAGLDQNNWGDLLQEDRSSRQLRNAGEMRLLQQASNIQESHNDNLSTRAFADGYWVMYDYNRGYANDLEASGIMDIFRLPKPSYYFYQSQRSVTDPFGKAMVHIANNWKKNSPLDIRIFSNCDQVELFLNGTSLGKQKPDKNRISNNLNHPPFTFSIPNFIAGKLEAIGYINDEKIASHTIETPQKATKIKLAVDHGNMAINSNDTVFVYAYITDDNGTVITDYKKEITFHINGKAILIGENPTNFDTGIASVLLKINDAVGEVKITASSDTFSSEYTINIQ